MMSLKHVKKRMLVCIEAGVGIGVILSGWVLLLALIQRSIWLTLDDSATRVNVLGIVALYIVGGAFAGAMVGLLQPLTRWRIGAAAVGAFAAFPIFAVVAGMISPATAPPFSPGYWFVTIVGAVSLGGIVGVVYREIFYEPPDDIDRAIDG